MTWWEEYRLEWRAWLESLGISPEHTETLMGKPKSLDFLYKTIKALHDNPKTNKSK